MVPGRQRRRGLAAFLLATITTTLCTDWALAFRTSIAPQWPTPRNHHWSSFHKDSCRRTQRCQATKSATADPATATTFHSTLLDGPCWQSLQQQFPSSNSKSVVGHLQVVAGVLQDDGGRVVGMLADSAENDDEETRTLVSGDVVVVADSLARIPAGMAVPVAAATYAFGLTHVHSLCSRVTRVGGSADASVVTPPRRAVVVGSNDDAVHAAQALQALGSDVTLVTTQTKLSVPKSRYSTSASSLTVTEPGMGNDDQSFCDGVGTFDALLDTLGNEYNDDNDDLSDSAVLRLLRDAHQCTTYVTTCTHAQTLIGTQGVFWGPGKIKAYHQTLQALAPHKVTAVAPPPQLGATVQTLLDAGVVWNAAPKPSPKQPYFIRSWDMGRYMEHTLWPTDSRGSGTVRYGFPVPGAADDEDDEDLSNMIAEPPSLSEMVRTALAERRAAEEDEDDEDDDEPLLTGADHVVPVQSLPQLQRLVQDQQTNQVDMVLFLSARFCRTCKKMQQPYRRMARVNGEEDGDEAEQLVFARGEASGDKGKLMGRKLGVAAVPTFILFKNGRRYGRALSISRLPSKQLELAIAYLKADKPWDDDLFRDTEGGKSKQTKL